MSSLYLKQLALGPMQNFVYLVGDRDTREAVAIDPAWDIDAILRTLAADVERWREPQKSLAGCEGLAHRERPV